jgi:transposase InsO family protein
MASQFPVHKMCRALGVSRSGYYVHLSKPAGSRRTRDEQLKPRIHSTFERSKGSYGSPRIMMELRREGERCGKNRIARLMREQGLRAKCKRRWRPRTTQSDPTLAAAPNLLAEVPSPGAPDQIWVSDITYLPTREGWHYLAVTMDLFSRRVVGWATSSSLETSLVLKALERALAFRGSAPGLIHHSDRGCQYASRAYREALRLAGITASMSRKGNCYDNANMESFFATFKTEVFDRTIADTRRQCELMAFDYIETFYNPRRLHSSLGYKSPLEFETQHHHTPYQPHHISPYAQCPV